MVSSRAFVVVTRAPRTRSWVVAVALTWSAAASIMRRRMLRLWRVRLRRLNARLAIGLT